MTQQAQVNDDSKKMTKKAADVPVDTKADRDDFGKDWTLDRPSFKPEMFTKRDDKHPDREIYTGPSVQGLWIAHTFLGKIEDEDGTSRDANVYIVKLTAPCKGVNREGEPVDVLEGEELMVWETTQLVQAIPPVVANHPLGVLHYRMTPKFRAPIPGKKRQKMWTYAFAEAKQAIVPRKSIKGGTNAIALLLATAPKQLPQPTAYDRMLDSKSQAAEDGGLPF